MSEPINIKSAIDSIQKNLNLAWRYLSRKEEEYDSTDIALLGYKIDCAIEKSFTTLLLLSEALGHQNYRMLVQKEYNKAKKQKGGFGATERDPYGDLFLIVYHNIDKLLQSFQAVYGFSEIQERGKYISISQILHNREYSLKGKLIPNNETELHERVEAILLCIYPDLKHKPSISKPIKNFEPDTGIPSIKTLIEYKYVTSDTDLKRVSEEISTDTQGYISPDWTNVIYLIYETKRIKSENQWNLHLSKCGQPKNTQAIVIRGETTSVRTSKKRKTTS